MPYRDRVEISFDAGHRLLNYQGKCSSPHGHTFRAEVVVGGDSLNAIGLLLDFGDIKRILKEWIDDNWDHGFLLNSDDHALVSALRAIPEAKIYEFPSTNPSAEAMARSLYCVAERQLGETLHSVRVWESTTQYAEYGHGGD